MGVEVRRAARWSQLVAQLAPAFTDPAPGPFEQPQVVVSSHGAGRVLRGQLATQLPAGICAGIGFVTLSAWLRDRAREHALLEEFSAWRSTRATLLAAGALQDLSDEHKVLGSHLDRARSSRRRLDLARRSIRLFNRYTEHAPEMVTNWLDEDDVDVDGRGLADHLLWQPALLRLTAERLQVDPVEVWEDLAAAVAQHPSPETTHLFALAEVAPVEATVLNGAAAAGDVLLWQVEGSPFPDWTRHLTGQDADVEARAAHGPRRIEVHGSHGPARQVEVLRDLLCARFEQDATLEPRDVLIVVDDAERWLPHLETAFVPVDGSGAHPGRQLRLAGSGGAAGTNHVLEVVRRCLRLGQSRAAATEITELLLLGPVAHRWKFDHRREDLTALVESAGIRWGLDGQHRSELGLPGITQNTWFRGIDRLLTGLALAPDTTSAVPVTGVATVGTSDLDLVGALSEAVSRLRLFNHHAQHPATAQVWVGRVLEVLAGLVRCSWADAWMETQATAALTSLAQELAEDQPELSRSEFTRLFEQTTREFPTRPSFGNGSMHVVGAGELMHVDHRLVCLLGVSDTASSGTVDSVTLGPEVLEPRRRRLAQLLARAQASEDLLVVFQARDPQTNQQLATPTTLTWLFERLGFPDVTVQHHPLLSFSPANFTTGASFDQQALATALAADGDGPRVRPHVVRRHRALALPDAPGPTEVPLADLTRFLADPAKEFLRSATEVRVWDPPRLRDELPFLPDALELWHVRDRLLAAFQQGLTPEFAVRREFEREQLPPGRIGAQLIEAPLEEVKDLWKQAFSDWQAPEEVHPLGVEIGGVLVSDAVRTRGGQVLAVTVSTGRRTEVQPWLKQLLLAAAGKPVPVRVHRMRRAYGKVLPETATLLPPPAERAKELLATIVEAHRQGRSRLLPVPQDLALVFVEQLSGDGVRTKQWDVPSSDWRRTLWRRPSELWELFYSEVPSEFFEDEATARDPEPPPGHNSAFAAWATAIYMDLVQGASS